MASRLACFSRTRSSCPVLLPAGLAVNRPSLGRLEWYLALSSAVGAYCLVHLTWSEPSRPTEPTIRHFSTLLFFFHTTRETVACSHGFSEKSQLCSFDIQIKMLIKRWYARFFIQKVDPAGLEPATSGFSGKSCEASALPLSYGPTILTDENGRYYPFCSRHFFRKYSWSLVSGVSSG